MVNLPATGWQTWQVVLIVIAATLFLTLGITFGLLCWLGYTGGWDSIKLMLLVYG